MKKNLPINRTIWISRSLAIVILLLSVLFATAQPGKTQTVKKVKWTELSNNRNATFYDVQKDFYQKWKRPLREMARAKRRHREEKQEAGGFEAFKRWESYMAPRVFPSGDMSLPSTNYANFMAWKKSTESPQTKNSKITNSPPPSSTGNWTSLGPVGSPAGPSPYSRTGAGRVNFVRFNPANSAIMYVGAPDGGLWKSTNSGTSWTTNTDFLSIIGCSDLAIDPANANIMYLATGDLEADRLSIGVLKSTNGGATWNTTGNVWAATDGMKISRLLMDPTNPLVMIISTNKGIFRTTDGWATFTQTQVGADLKSMEFKPGDHNTIYAAGINFWKSTNNGATWVQVTTGLPSANVSRIALGVSAGNSAYVYALIGKADDQGFLGMYRSANSGTSFSLRASTPNLLGYAADGSDVGGQAFYDLSVAVSPTDANVVTTGGVNHWQSSDGGATWANLTVWDAGQIHADVHRLNYLPASSTTLFSCNDGGIFKSTDNGANWTDLSHNLTIAEVVGIGLSANVSTTMIDGEQDNGTNLKTGAAWNNVFGGDGGQCFIDYTNNNTLYIQYVQGDFERSDDAGATTTTITTGLPAGGSNGAFDFYSSWHEDPVTSARLYVAGTPTLYRSNNQGASWNALGTPPGSGTITDFAIAPSNNTIIYAVKTDAISKSTNSGLTFTDITGTLPATASFSNVTVSNTDPNKVWVTYSGYSATDKVYSSIDGGANWTNISTGLPNIPINTIVHVNGSAIDAVYAGADIGVYYFDNTLLSWLPFMTSLPNNAVKDLKIYYPTSKIRAATYGRGVWESDLRPAASATDATLSNLAIKRIKNGNSSTATLSPVFNSATLGYSITAPNSTATVTLTPTTNNAAATVKVNGTTVASGTPSSGINLIVGPNNTITTVVTAQDGTTTGTYTVSIDRRNALGQLNAFYLPISVNQEPNPQLLDDGIVVHSALSPNGDGINDVFTIDGLQAYPDNKVTIMNRDGVVIFKTDGYDNSSKVFDGHSNINGKMQLPGTYFYTVEYQANGDTKRKTGYIVLKY